MSAGGPERATSLTTGAERARERASAALDGAILTSPSHFACDGRSRKDESSGLRKQFQGCAFRSIHSWLKTSARHVDYGGRGRCLCKLHHDVRRGAGAVTSLSTWTEKPSFLADVLAPVCVAITAGFVLRQPVVVVAPCIPRTRWQLRTPRTSCCPPTLPGCGAPRVPSVVRDPETTAVFGTRLKTHPHVLNCTHSPSHLLLHSSSNTPRCFLPLANDFYFIRDAQRRESLV
ncbi:uncharacterized protein LOC142930067 [Petromyzon marinus]|uniref:uncharacterized protein LOC142930067 n=1 Tax=Petromyzon marinus TaxID=7757 RepID=UPI003F6EB382